MMTDRSGLTPHSANGMTGAGGRPYTFRDRDDK
ncbi:MAG: hypothetical protein METHAR1v1_1470011 [Methanothrix sp.]|nr:MAG: hypothetical protein METHAR1v1_1470011 [Methanothrix sp.]